MYGTGTVRAGISTVVGLSAALLLATVVAASAGCDGDDTTAVDQHRVEPYQIAAVDIDIGGDDEEWTPANEEVQQWFDDAVDDSHRGLSRRQAGMGMHATVYHRTRLQPMAGGARIAVDVDAHLHRSLLATGDSMINLRATATAQEELSGRHPSHHRLRRIAHDLGKEAQAEVVDRLRLRARLEQYGDDRLAAWIGDDRLGNAQRQIAIEWAIDEDVAVDDALRGALVKSADGDDDDLVWAACRALVALDVDGAERIVMERAQRYSRDKKYDRFLDYLPLLGRLDAAWISIYLETVAEAHAAPQVRDEARSIVADRPSPTVGDYPAGD